MEYVTHGGSDWAPSSVLGAYGEPRGEAGIIPLYKAKLG